MCDFHEMVVHAAREVVGGEPIALEKHLVIDGSALHTSTRVLCVGFSVCVGRWVCMCDRCARDVIE